MKQQLTDLHLTMSEPLKTQFLSDCAKYFNTTCLQHCVRKYLSDVQSVAVHQCNIVKSLQFVWRFAPMAALNSWILYTRAANAQPRETQTHGTHSERNYTRSGCGEVQTHATPSAPFSTQNGRDACGVCGNSVPDSPSARGSWVLCAASCAERGRQLRRWRWFAVLQGVPEWSQGVIMQFSGVILCCVR